MAVVEKKVRKKVRANVSEGVINILSTFNNTIVTVTDQAGNVLCWSSAGVKGFKGSRKSTPYAAQVAAQDAAQKARDMGMRSVVVNLKGPGAGRESAVRGLISSGLLVTIIRDKTPVPHNGCRPRKRRRV